jgi:hypothetical protein
VGPIATLRWTRRLRRHGAALSAIVVLSVALAAHHGVWSTDDPHHGGMGTMTLVEVCLGVFAAVATVVAAAVGFIRLRRWRPPATLGTARRMVPLSLDLPRSRAGPSACRLLCVIRR